MGLAPSSVSAEGGGRVPSDGDLQRYHAARAVGGKAFRSACYAPSVSLYFHPSGRVQACCKNDRFTLGDIRTESLDAIWNGARIGKLRAALANDAFGAGCQQCAWQIASGNLQDVYTRVFDDLPVESAVPQWPAMLEFALANTCNFACVMCYGDLSSVLRAREGRPPLPRVYDDRFFADVRKYLPHLKRAKFFGGEPFLIAECFRLWEQMIADGLATPCHVTTNGSIWNARVEQVLAGLPFSVSVSVDGATRETFEAIRRESDFAVVQTNLRRFRAYTRERGTDFTLCFCLMPQNWHEMVDVLLLAEELECPVWVNTVTDPANCSIFMLAEAEQLRIADALERANADAGERLRLNRGVLINEIASLRRHAEQKLGQQIRDVRQAAAVEWKERAEKAHVAAAGGAGSSTTITVRARPPAAEPLIARAWAHLKAGRHSEAQADLEAIRQADDRASVDPVSLLHLAAQLALESGRLVEALDGFGQLVTRRPGHPDFRVGRAWAAFWLGHTAAALAEAQAVLALHPDHAGARHLRNEASSPPPPAAGGGGEMPS